MTFIAKPRLRHPNLATNKFGFTHRDYEGTVSTLCAGCGHDSITAALVQAFWEMAVDEVGCGEVLGRHSTPSSCRVV